GRLVVPLGIEEIDGVLERARDAVVVLGRDEDVAVERGDLLRPAPGVLLPVIAQRGRPGLVQQRQVIVPEVNQLEAGIAALAGDRFAEPPRAGAAEDDSDFDHVRLRPGELPSKITLRLLPGRRKATPDGVATSCSGSRTGFRCRLAPGRGNAWRHRRPARTAA